MASYETRGNTVRAVVRLPGGKKKSASFDDEPAARAWAAIIEGQVAVLAGMTPARAAAAKGGTNEELFQTYLEAVASKLDSAKFNALRLNKWCRDPIAKLRTEATTTHDINGWIERSLTQVSGRIKRPLSGSTVNRELNLMSAAFTYAVKSLQWIKVNPCHGAMRPEQGRARKRPLLTPDEIQALLISTGYTRDPGLATLSARVGAGFLLTLETGMRSGELLRLRPIDYRRAEKFLHVSATERGGRKGASSGRSQADPSRDVPLTDRAVEILDALVASVPADQSPQPGFSKPPYIMGMNDEQRDALWRKARDRSGVEDLHFHDTKHEAATRLSRFIDVLALSHAIGTKDVQLLRDTYYNKDATRTAKLLPSKLADHAPAGVPSGRAETADL